MTTRKELMIVKEKRKNEAIKRTEELQKAFGLSKDLVQSLKDNIVMFSYETAKKRNGRMAPISSQKKYSKIVREFEEKNNCYVYHAIETRSIFNKLILTLLFVSGDEEEWELDRLEDNYIYAYCVNIQYPECSEYGDVFLEASKNHIALVRGDITP